MDNSELIKWFEANKTLLETANVAGEQPWQQSGFGLHSKRTYEHWEAVRRPVADCIDKAGTFLDVGCANGYLLECVIEWVGKRDISIIPYGLDLSEKLVALARKRLPIYADYMFVGNAWNWVPPRIFDFVRTELVYVPDELHPAFVARLVDVYLSPGGKLLVVEYRGKHQTESALTIDRYLDQLGFRVATVKSGFWNDLEQTRVAVIHKAA